MGGVRRRLWQVPGRAGQGIAKYTLAELEEEEQSLDRLRRWYRELRSRDVLGIPATTDSATSLKRCEERFETYADHAYATLSSPTV
jgi:hypothetical protein